MYKYTPEGVNEAWNNLSVVYLDDIDTKLRKIYRRLGIIAVIATAEFIFKHKDAILALKTKKGE